jgi:endoglucanase
MSVGSSALSPLMTPRRLTCWFACALVCVCALVLGATASALADVQVAFAPTHYAVNESQGSAVLTLTRSGDLHRTTRVFWYTEQPSSANPAIPDIDFAQTNTHSPGSLTFAPGQSQAQISVPVTNHDMPEPTKQFSVKVFAKGAVGADNVAAVQILGDDPMPAVRNPSDPLALEASGLGYQSSPVAGTASATLANPLSGVSFYVPPVVPATAIATEPQTNLFLEGSATNMSQYGTALKPIWSQPQQMRFGDFDVDASGVDRTSIDVSNYLEEAQAKSPGTVPQILTYDLCHTTCKLPGDGKPTYLQVKPCGHKADTPQQVAAFENFVNLLAAGISDHRVVLYLEMDGLITTQCLTHQGLQTRLHELAYAVNKLSALPRAAIYVDGGAADAERYKVMARDLNKIGVRKIQGFFLNSTHADWTLNEIAYGQKISKLTRGAHFVVNTAVNGRGPERSKHPAKQGSEVLCNPTTLGLGPKPTTSTSYWHVDAFAWLGYTGLSDGPCPAQPGNPFQARAGTYMPQYAELLIRHADYRVRGTVPKRAVRRVHAAAA